MLGGALRKQQHPSRLLAPACLKSTHHGRTRRWSYDVYNMSQQCYHISNEGHKKKKGSAKPGVRACNTLYSFHIAFVIEALAVNKACANLIQWAVKSRRSNRNRSAMLFLSVTQRMRDQHGALNKWDVSQVHIKEAFTARCASPLAQRLAIKWMGLAAAGAHPVARTKTRWVRTRATKASKALAPTSGSRERTALDRPSCSLVDKATCTCLEVSSCPSLLPRVLSCQRPRGRHSLGHPRHDVPFACWDTRWSHAKPSH